MGFTDSKFFLKSKSILGLIVAGVPAVAQIIDAQFGTHLVASQLVAQIIQIGGLILAFIGRLTADTKLTLKP